MTSQFVATFKRLLQRDRLADNLHHMTTDADAALSRIDTSAPVDPFAVMLKLVYQLTHRTLGSNDVADDPKLLADTLAVFGRLDDSSAVEIMFPMLPWPSKLRKMWAGARLHWAFTKIINHRRKTGKTDTDAMQTLMDEGHPDIFISVVSLGTRSLPVGRGSVTDKPLSVHHGLPLRRPDQQHLQRRLDPRPSHRQARLVRADTGRGRWRPRKVPPVPG